MPKILFTAENAAEMAKRSHLNRTSNPADNFRANGKPHAADKFLTDELARVRKQIKMLNDRIDAEVEACPVGKDGVERDNSQAIDRLASAIARLSERERQLANRPLPGSYKPQVQRTKRSYAQTEQPSSIETRTSVEPTTGGVPPSAQ